ncbi:CMRF35-like molecule 1 [Molossus molossus]|uniref:CMRF35-like molecule 1 n=1 Tax=Molossus molossus TaxID=27622 RepID=UPI0017472A31|nr:CMRF35-like molecule 1 [Molossus molossus]
MTTYLPLLFPLFWVSVSSVDITGPEEAKGLEQGWLEVQCRYAPGWKTYKKWWCRGADWGSCKILVKTNGSKQEAKRNRVTIRDDQSNRTFTVTMKALRREDTDVYWCGIERAGADHGMEVNVIIGPATTTVSTTITAIISTTTMFTVPVTMGNPAGSPTATSPPSDGSFFTDRNILLPVLSALLLLLLLAASLLAWGLVRRQKKAAGVVPGQELGPLEDDLCYANLALQQTGPPTSPSRKKAPTKPPPSVEEDRVEVEYVTMASFPREDVAYAVLSLDASDQDSTYVNTGDLITPLPRSHEEYTEYSTVGKPSLH